MSKHRDINRMVAADPRWAFSKNEMEQQHKAIEHELKYNAFLGKWLLLDSSALKKEFPHDLQQKLAMVSDFERDFVRVLACEVDATLCEFQSRSKAMERSKSL